jgi:outer membrane protein OmpA-like peptidoglycan-associated protein
MKGRLTAWLLTGLLAMGPAALAQSGDDSKNGEVKTWMATDGDGEEYEVRPATPSYVGDTGLFHVSSAYTLPKGKVAFSLFRDNLDRDPKDIDFSIHGLNAAFGVTNKLELFGQIGIQNRVDTDALFQSGFWNDAPFTLTPWETGFGDIRLGAKYGFLSDYGDHDALGLAAKASVKLPTADEAKGLGTGKTSFDANFIASVGLGDGAADIHGTIGYQWNGDPDGLSIGNALKLGAGVNIPACHKWFQVQGELLYTNYSDADFDQTDPLDFVVGPVFFIKPGFFIRPALSGNLNFDDRGLDSGSVSWLGRQIEIGYHPGTVCHRKPKPTPPPVVPPPTNRPPTVSCDVEKSQLQPGETVRCRATASDPDGDSLTYEWSADMGKISGTGPDATWDSTGAAAGSSATITVRVSDGRGGTAEAKCRVSLDKPRGVAPVTCTAGSFPANSARLNNVDKACLDDVASRLKQDPRARVVVVGHADSKEKYPEVIGRKRAEAVKTYLVKERGIDESRISVRSAAARRPANTGTTPQARAENRRVEITVVPEGMDAPE